MSAVFLFVMNLMLIFFDKFLLTVLTYNSGDRKLSTTNKRKRLNVMGLDISCVRIKGEPSDGDGHLFRKGGYEYQFGNLKEGVYEVEFLGAGFQCHYHRWGQIREELAIIAGWPRLDNSFEDRYPHTHYPELSGKIKDWNDLPLLSLICFTDCDGVICNKVCKDIFEDLSKLDLTNRDYLVKIRDIFETASNSDAVVIFH